MKQNHEKTIDTLIWRIKNEIPIIKKKTKGIKFKYADLDTIENALEPHIKREGVCYSHKVYYDGHSNVLETRIYLEKNHSDNKVLSMRIPEGVQKSGMDDFQVLGAAITYFRRYHLVTAFGLNTQEDLDSYQAQEKENQKKENKRLVDHVAKVKSLIERGRAKGTIIRYVQDKKVTSQSDLKQIQELIKANYETK